MITVSYNDRKYTLTYNREAVVYLQDRGFNPDEIRAKPNIMIPLLFRGAFYANHREIKTKLCDEIFENLKGRGELISKLLEMYHENVNSLFDDSGESEGNAMWEET